MKTNRKGQSLPSSAQPRFLRISAYPLRYATPRSAPFFPMIGMAWILGSIAAIALWNSAPFGAYMPPGGRLVIGFQICAVLLSETLLAGFLLAAGKTLLDTQRPSSIYGGAAILILSIAFLTVLLFLSLVSWILLSLHIGFITRSSLLSTLLDFSSISPFLSAKEWASLAAALAVSAIAVLAAAAIAPVIRARRLAALGVALLAALSLMIASFRIIPELLLTKVNTERIESILRAQLLPVTTIVWAPLILPSPNAGATITTPLARQYDRNAYAAMIDKKRPRPNILVFAIEALRAGEVLRQVNGRPVMPTAAKLATEGVNFTRAYSQGNESLYSMTSVISGLHPLKSPDRDRFTGIDYPLLRINDVLSPVYHTAFVSSSNEKWQNMVNITRSPNLELFLDAETYTGPALPPDRADSGFYDEIAKGHLRTGTLDDATTTAQLQQWLTQKFDKPDERPFYATVSFQSSHYPYEQAFHVPALFTPNTFTPEESSSFSFIYYPRQATSRMWNRYWNSLAYIDTQIAATVQLLKQHGALENTIIVIHGDHGELFYENGSVTHAAHLHDKTLHISLVMAGAKDVPAGEYVQPVSLLDLGPMLLDVVGMPEYKGFQGSVPPGLRNPDRRAKGEYRPVFSTVQNIAFEDSVIVGRWKFIEQAQGLYANLYDLSADPLEQTSVLTQNTPVANCLKETLHNFRRNQFAYYGSFGLKTEYFPPRHDLAPVLACGVTFSSR